MRDRLRMDRGLKILAADAPGGLICLTDCDIAPRRVRVELWLHSGDRHRSGRRFARREIPAHRAMWRLVTEGGTRTQEAAWMEAEATAEVLGLMIERLTRRLS